MKALTLHQPWATAVALGIKTVETRSWRTDYRGPLVVHAGAKVPPYNDHGVPVSLVPRPDGLVGHFGGIAHPLPLGAIVATCRLVDVVPIVDVAAAEEQQGAYVEAGGEYLSLWRPGASVAGRIDDQRPWGDYRCGRWAWLLDDVKPTTERCPACWGRATVENSTWGRRIGCPTCEVAGHCDPVPAKGARGLWEWTP